MRMGTCFKYNWSILNLSCMLMFAVNVYLLLRLIAEEKVTLLERSQEVTAVFRPAVHHPFSHLLPSLDLVNQTENCTQPKLSLTHDSISFAFHSMPPLTCSGLNLFSLQDGYLIPTVTDTDHSKPRMCEVYAVKRESDFHSYLEKLLETNASSRVKINDDFIYMRCHFSGNGNLEKRQVGDVAVNEKDSTLGEEKAQNQRTAEGLLAIKEENQIFRSRHLQGEVPANILLRTKQSAFKTSHDIWSEVTVAQDSYLGKRRVDNDKTAYDYVTVKKHQVKVVYDGGNVRHDTRQNKVGVIHYNELATQRGNLKHNAKQEDEMQVKYYSHLNLKGSNMKHGALEEKIKHDMPMIEIDSSTNNDFSSQAYNFNRTVHNQSFSHSQKSFQHSPAVSNKNSMHIKKIGMSSKSMTTTRMYIGLIHIKKPTSHENQDSFGVRDFPELNNDGQNISTALSEQVKNSPENIGQSSEMKPGTSVRHSIVESSNSEIGERNNRLTSLKELTVDEKVMRNDDSNEDVDVIKFDDSERDNEQRYRKKRGLEASRSDRVREFDHWEEEGLLEEEEDENFEKSEENYPEAQACDEEQFLVQVHPHKHVFDRHRSSKAARTSGMNVLMFGIDSVSNMMFQRKLPLALNFLKKDLEAVVFEGYNIVGDATTQALLPLFLGKLEQDIPNLLDTSLDQFDFVWKRYQQHGYVTLYAEDEPHLGVFNLRLKGFEDIPTDHYMRYFWQARAKSHLNLECSTKYCTGATPNHQFLFQYLIDFFRKYPKIPHFGVGFSGELSHDDPNPSEYLDRDLVAFLRELRDKGYLSNTVLVVFADHGSRKGKLRQTLQGKLEERLPFMSMVFPRSFRKKHRVLFENLTQNAKGLTTAFDVHETLLDILDVAKVYATEPKTARGVSLFRSIPANRTCSQAGIDTHWCTCIQEIPVPLSDPVIKGAAEAVITAINNLTQADRHECAQLHLVAIHSASLVTPNLQVLKFHKTAQTGNFSASFGSATVDMAEFQVTVETDQCQGVFETTVQVLFRQNDNESVDDRPSEARLSYNVLEHRISRINVYGSQSSCICKSNPRIMKFCCCKRYLMSEQMTSC